MDDYGRKDEVKRAPQGLDAILQRTGMTLGDLKQALAASPVGVRVPGSRGLKAFARNRSIVIERLELTDGADIIWIVDRYYLRVRGQSLPDTVISALPGRPLNALVESDALPAALSASIVGAYTTSVGDLLIAIDWPLEPC